MEFTIIKHGSNYKKSDKLESEGVRLESIVLDKEFCKKLKKCYFLKLSEINCLKVISHVFKFNTDENSFVISIRHLCDNRNKITNFDCNISEFDIKQQELENLEVHKIE